MSTQRQFSKWFLNDTGSAKRHCVKAFRLKQAYTNRDKKQTCARMPPHTQQCRHIWGGPIQLHWLQSVRPVYATFNYVADSCIVIPLAPWDASKTAELNT